MSDFKHQDGTVFLFPNKHKSAESDPDYRGTGFIHGRESQVRGWNNTDKNGQPYIKIIAAAGASRPRYEDEPLPTQRPSLRDSLEDEAPF